MSPGRPSASRSVPRAPRSSRGADESLVKARLVAVASDIVREQGLSGLTIAVVLERAELSTRIFYRNFGSKDDLIQTVFTEMARGETERLRRAMRAAKDPVHGVAAWIVCRLDLAFDPDIRSDVRVFSREAQSALFSAPQLVSGAFTELLAPLCEQLEEGRRTGMFPDIEPSRTAELIHGALWACIESRWSSGDADRTDTVWQVLTFCLGGLHAPSARVEDAINAVTGAGPAGALRRLGTKER